jgi:uncharacterized NAD-dependent epimerase/dehydratase family protein
MLGKPRRLAILAEARFTPLDAKTAVGVLRYRPEEVAAVVDSTRAGRTTRVCVGVGGEVPVVGTIEQAAAAGADSLLIGVAPQGGELPDGWRAPVLEALRRGWDVIAGLHAFLGDDPELAAAARGGGARLYDVRRPPISRRVAARRVMAAQAWVVLTVGSDCNVGKMTAALELQRGLARRHVRAAFVATGQTGILVADRGLPADAVPADFVAGEIEHLVLEAAAEVEVVVVEGQGALHHPGYSGVTLALLHGAAPQAMILCHQAGRENVRRPGANAEQALAEPAIPPLPELIETYERAAGWVRPSRVIGIALNTWGMNEAEAQRAVLRAAEETRVPATDPVRFGAEALVEAVLAGCGRDRAPLG